MKTLIKKLVPGAAFVAAVALVISLARAQSPETVNSPAPMSAPASQPATVFAPGAPIAPAAQITLCGGCGAELAQPRAVYVAQPVRGAQPVRLGGNGYGQSFYGMPALVQAPPAVVVPAGYYVDDAGACYYRPGAPRQSIYGLSTQWAIPAHRIPPGRAYCNHNHGRGGCR